VQTGHSLCRTGVITSPVSQSFGQSHHAGQHSGWSMHANAGHLNLIKCQRRRWILALWELSWLLLKERFGTNELDATLATWHKPQLLLGLSLQDLAGWSLT
jgi:hypothetical protein